MQIAANEITQNAITEKDWNGYYQELTIPRTYITENGNHREWTLPRIYATENGHRHECTMHINEN